MGALETPTFALTPLNAYSSAAGQPFYYVTSHDIISRLHHHALSVYHNPAYHPSNVSARSTRAGGAMALLCAGVDSDRMIWLIGWWHSDELYHYLHVQAQPVMTGISATMLRGGSYGFAPLQSTTPTLFTLGCLGHRSVPVAHNNGASRVLE